MTECMPRQHTPTKDTTTRSTIHPKNTPTHPHRTPTTQRTTEMTMKVGCCRHGVVIAAPVDRDERQRCRAAVAVARPAAAAREAKEGLPPAAGEETKASRRP